MPLRVRCFLPGPAPKNPFQHASGLYSSVLALLQAGLPPEAGDLAKRIHDLGVSPPFALSPILATEDPQLCCFDLSLLPDWLPPALHRGLESSPEPLRLGNLRYPVLQVTVEAQESWQELLSNPPGSEPGLKARLLTATAHHAGGPRRPPAQTDPEPRAAGSGAPRSAARLPRKSVPLPSPELYFRGWLQRWNSPWPVPRTEEGEATAEEERLRWEARWPLAAPPELRLDPQELLPWVETHVAVSACQGQTDSVRLGPWEKGEAFAAWGGTPETRERGGAGPAAQERDKKPRAEPPFIGFVGEVLFTVLKPRQVPPEVLRKLLALGRFARYCGTGARTAWGLGQTVTWVR